jgi:hypothetical protein
MKQLLRLVLTLYLGATGLAQNGATGPASSSKIPPPVPESNARVSAHKKTNPAEVKQHRRKKKKGTSNKTLPSNFRQGSKTSPNADRQSQQNPNTFLSPNKQTK